MAAKYLHSLADENPDLQKQIGCMTGVFQIFNRHHVVSRRRVISNGPKRVDSGSLLLNDGTPQRESSVMGQRHLAVEKYRVPTKSSKDSTASRLMNNQNLDLRDVVKDSMYREARGLSHNTAMKEESNHRYHDEPRQLSRSKSCQFRDRIPSSVYKDYPRFSYDGQETDSVSIKTNSKTAYQKQLKELPRLSLDSRERSIRTLSLVPTKPSNLKSNNSRNLITNVGVDADMDLSQTRPPGVVAKLMGLETFPLLKSPDDCGSIVKMTNSTRISLKEPKSPCRKNRDMKQISGVPIEPAPWKQRDGTRVIRSITKMHSPASSVYSEVDKKLKNLEFAESGNDLRALKEILEVMQVVEARKDKRQETTDISSDHGHQNPPCVSRELDVSRGHESHIVIMKPSKLVKKDFTNNITGKDLITKSTRGERRSRPSMPCKDSTKPRKHLNKQQTESRPPSRRKKPLNIKKTDYQSRETEMLSESSEESNSRQSSSSTPDKKTLIMKVDEPLTPEYPSPVSVLDDSVYADNSPSPVKRNPITKRDDASGKIVKDQCEATNYAQSNTMISRVSFQTNHEKLKKVENLVQKLKNLNSSHNEFHTDYITSVCENTNTNNKYISEIFLASGLLLRDLQSFNLHPSGHPINPELFSVLEHTKFSNLQKEKFHRKLIFDTVNEILVRKLCSASGMIFQNPRTLLRELCLEIEQLQVQKKRDGCGLVNDVDDDDLNNILWEDVLKRSENWTGFYGELPVIAMEIERLILTDLVDEVVMSQNCEVQQRMLSRCC